MAYTQIPLSFDLSANLEVGETTSQAIDLTGTVLMGLITPDNLTATSFTFLASPTANDADFVPLCDLQSGNPIPTGTLDVSKYYATVALNFSSVRFIKLVGNTAQLTTPAAVKLITRPVA
jgi:hypothetical protein